MPEFSRYIVVSVTLLTLSTVFLPHIAVADTTAPSEPGNLRSVRYSSTSGEILWTSSTDNRAVVGYNVTRDGQSLASAGCQKPLWAGVER